MCNHFHYLAYCLAYCIWHTIWPCFNPPLFAISVKSKLPFQRHSEILRPAPDNFKACFRVFNIFNKSHQKFFNSTLKLKRLIWIKVEFICLYINKLWLFVFFVNIDFNICWRFVDTNFVNFKEKFPLRDTMCI